MSDEIKSLLSERGSTHGDYSENARISQAIMRVYESSPHWSSMPDALRNTLQMEAQKNGRIMAGNPFVVDHWKDKIGYCQLVVDRLVDGVSVRDTVIDPEKRVLGEEPELGLRQLHYEDDDTWRARVRRERRARAADSEADDGDGG